MLMFKQLIVECYGGLLSEARNCCSSDKPCKLNQGDCDHDGECEGDLICGMNNCGPNFSWDSADCCMKPGNLYLISL